MMQEDSNGEFEIVDKMTSLVVSDSSSPRSSVLTNVAPPSALPSFLTSPLPAAASSLVLPPGSTVSPGLAVSPPCPALSPSTTSIPSPITSTLPCGSSIPSSLTSGIPPPGTKPIYSPDPPAPPSDFPTPYPDIPPSGVSAPSPNTIPVNPVTGVPSPGTVPFPPGSSTFVPVSGASLSSENPNPPLSSFHPSSKSTPAPLSSHSADPGLAPQSYCLPAVSSSILVTSQPQPHDSHGSSGASASVDLGSPGISGPAGRGDGRGWFGWIRGTVSSVGHRVAERAKTSMDTMITTLDPQMKEFIYSGGDMDIVVASDKEIKIGAIREAFQAMFGKATVSGMTAQAQGVAAQPVGFEAALKSAEERINNLRSTGHIHPQQPIVAVENFIVEFSPDRWFDLGLLLLDDPGKDILLQTYTQVTPVPSDYVSQVRNSTPEDYPFKETGFAATIGQIASQSLQVHHTMWQETLTGVSRRETLVLAGRTLAALYKAHLTGHH